MAREHAKIRLDIWADGEWRDLDVDCQHLYLLLLSHPTLSYVGVADWRPGRIAQLAKGLTAEKVRETAARLQELHFILMDDESEEVLIRSFVKHDGLLKQPKMSVSMANAFAATASNPIREVIAFEVQKLRERDPDLAAWKVKQVQTVLDAKGSPIDAFTLSVTPGVTPELTPGFRPNATRPQGLRTTTATSTATKKSESASRGSRVPEPFVITDELRAWAKAEAPLVDIDRKTPEFVDYWASVPGKGGVKLDWSRTWKNDMRKKQEFAERDRSKSQPGRRVPANDEWMYR